MGFKDIQQLEDLLFQCIEGIHQAKQFGDKNSYQLALSTLELLNEDYKKINNLRGFLSPERILKYHEGLWENQWRS